MGSESTPSSTSKEKKFPPLLNVIGLGFFGYLIYTAWFKANEPGKVTTHLHSVPRPRVTRPTIKIPVTSMHETVYGRPAEEQRHERRAA